MQFSTLALLLAAVLTVSAWTSDPQCVAKGGTCEMSDSTCTDGQFLSGLCPSLSSIRGMGGSTVKCCVKTAACNDQCWQTGRSKSPKQVCKGSFQSVAGKTACVCTCAKSGPQMCGSSSSLGSIGVTKSPCVVPSPGGVCDANGKCQTSATNTALSKTCVPC